MQIKDIMTKEVITVKLGTKIKEIAKLLKKHGIHGVPVVDKDEKVLGIVTEKDFFTRDSVDIYLPSFITFLKKSDMFQNVSGAPKKNARKLFNTTAEDIMAADCVTVNPDMDLQEFLNVYDTYHFITYPVTDLEGKLIGIVTITDLINLMTREVSF